MTAPKTVVLPLHHGPIKPAIIKRDCLNIASANVEQKNNIARNSCDIFKKKYKKVHW